MTNVLATKAVLANLNISLWAARKFDKKVTDKTHEAFNASSDAGRYNKMLIAKEALAELNKVAGSARRHHYALTLPWITNGPCLLPTEHFDKHTKLREDMKLFHELADKFAAAYPSMIQEAKKRLNGMFCEADYPSPDKIRSKFEFDIKYFPCPDSGDFRVTLSDEVMETMKSDLEMRMSGAVDNAMQSTRDRIVDVVSHMAEKLKGYKPPTETDRASNTFHDSLVDNVRDLAEMLPAFNLTSDPKMTKIIDRIRSQLCAVDADELRDNEHERQYVAKAAASILKDVSNFMA